MRPVVQSEDRESAVITENICLHVRRISDRQQTCSCCLWFVLPPAGRLQTQTSTSLKEQTASFSLFQSWRIYFFSSLSKTCCCDHQEMLHQLLFILCLSFTSNIRKKCLLFSGSLESMSVFASKIQNKSADRDQNVSMFTYWLFARILTTTHGLHQQMELFRCLWRYFIKKCSKVKDCWPDF